MGRRHTNRPDPRPTTAADQDGAAFVSAVVFDLGGVLLDWDPTYLLTPTEVDELDIGGVQRELDLGAPLEQVRARWRARYPHRATTIDHYLDEWSATLPGAIDATVEVFAELRHSGVGLYALSNFSGVLFRRERHRFAFLEWFDGVVISGDERLIKPDRAIYVLLLERYDLDPATTVFIDDRAVNVEAARSAGMLGIRYTSASELREVLTHLGAL